MLKKFADNTLFHVLIIILAAILNFLPTLQMFFYLDEWGALYDFTHSEYRYNVFTTHIMYGLYRLFGVDPAGYFGVGTAIFTLSVILFYLLASSLFKNKMLGFIAGLVYATAPIGITTATMVWTFVVEGGYPLTVALLLLLYLLLQYFRRGKVYYYLLVLIGFFIFLELEPRRVFMFLPILILFDYLVNFKDNFRVVFPGLGFFVRALLFFGVFIVYYKYNLTLSGIFTTGRIVLNESATTYDGLAKFWLGVDTFTHIKPLVTMMNVLLGGPWVFLTGRITEYIDLSDPSQIYFLVFLVLSLAVALVILAWKTSRDFGILALLGLVWIYINIFCIYVFSSPGVSDTTHRTLSLAAPGYALFYTALGAALYRYIKNRKKLSKNLNNIFILVTVIFVGVNFLATRYHFEQFNNFRSYATHAFFKDLKSYYPSFPANSLLYFQTPESPQIKYKLSRIYGGSPIGTGATIAIFYPELTKEEIDVTREYKDVEEFVENDLEKIDQVFAFYFDEKGLSDKTADVRSKLQKQ